MTTWFVSRHPGARDWARAQGIAVDSWVDHLDPALVRPGDLVVGTLPVHQAARVCAAGARYWHLVLELTPESRGRELRADELRRLGARLEEFSVRAAGG